MRLQKYFDAEEISRKSKIFMYFYHIYCVKTYVVIKMIQKQLIRFVFYLYKSLFCRESFQIILSYLVMIGHDFMAFDWVQLR